MSTHHIWFLAEILLIDRKKLLLKIQCMSFSKWILNTFVAKAWAKSSVYSLPYADCKLIHLGVKYVTLTMLRWQLCCIYPLHYSLSSFWILSAVFHLLDLDWMGLDTRSTWATKCLYLSEDISLDWVVNIFERDFGITNNFILLVSLRNICSRKDTYRLMDKNDTSQNLVVKRFFHLVCSFSTVSSLFIISFQQELLISFVSQLL